MNGDTKKLHFWLCIWLTLADTINGDAFMETHVKNDNKIQGSSNEKFCFQGVKLRLERTKCKCAPDSCSVVCSVKFISREIANFNVVVKLLKQVNYLEYHLKSYYKHSNNEYRPMMINFKDEFCKSYRSPLATAHLFLAIIGNATNANKPCPFNTGNYYVKDFNFSIKHWPSSFIPEGRHLINFTVYSQPNTFLANIEVYFEVINHSTLDLRVG